MCNKVRACLFFLLLVCTGVVFGTLRKDKKRVHFLSVKEKDELLLSLNKRVTYLQDVCARLEASCGKFSKREMLFDAKAAVLGKEVSALELRVNKKISVLESILPKYIDTVERLARAQRDSEGELYSCDHLVVPYQVRVMVADLLRTAAHARLKPDATREMFLAYMSAINASDVRWAHNVRRNKMALQSWLSAHATELTREEFLNVINVLRQCLETYNQIMSSTAPADKVLRLLVKREVWRFFYTAHGTVSDLEVLLERAETDDDALAWSLIIAKRLGAVDGAGIPTGLLEKIINVYTTKLNRTIACAEGVVKDLYVQSKADMLAVLQGLKKF